MRLIASLLMLAFTSVAVSASEPDRPEKPPVLTRPVTPAEEVHRDALTRYGLGIWRARQDRLAESAKQQQAAADREPNAAAPQKELARIYRDLGRDPAAIRAARKALELDPTDPDMAHLLGLLMRDAKQFALAGKLFVQASECPGWKDRPALRLVALREAVRAFREVPDHESVEKVAREALAILRGDRIPLTLPGAFTPTELERLRGKLYEQMGDSLVSLKKPEAAEAAYETARKIFLDPSGAKDPQSAARVNWNLSGVALARNDQEAALKYLKLFLMLRPSSMEPYQRYVQVMYSLKRQEELLTTLSDYALDNPKNLNIVWLLAAERMRQDFAVGDKAFRELATRSNDAEGFTLAVKSYTQARHGKELLDFMDTVFRAAKPKKDPDPDTENTDPDPGAAPPVEAVNRARFLSTAVRNNKDASNLLEVQISAELQQEKIRPTETLEIVTWCAMRDGNIGPLIDSLRIATRNQLKPETYNLLVFYLRQQRRWSEIVVLSRLARESKAFANKLTPYYNEAAAHAERGDLLKSLDAIDYVIKNVVADGKLSARLEKARLLNILGKFQEAITECADIRTEFPNASIQRRVRLILADSYNGLKDYLKSEAQLRANLEDDPDDVLTLNNLGYNLADQGRKLEEAELMIRRAIELDSFDRLRSGQTEAKSGSYLDSLGWVLFRRGKLAEARKLLEQAANLPDAGPDAVVWDHLGDVRFRQGEKALARTAWQQADELYKDSHFGRQAGSHDELKRKLKLVE